MLTRAEKAAEGADGELEATAPSSPPLPALLLPTSWRLPAPGRPPPARAALALRLKSLHIDEATQRATARPDEAGDSSAGRASAGGRPAGQSQRGRCAKGRGG